MYCTSMLVTIVLSISKASVHSMIYKEKHQQIISSANCSFIGQQKRKKEFLLSWKHHEVMWKESLNGAKKRRTKQKPQKKCCRNKTYMKMRRRKKRLFRGERIIGKVKHETLPDCRQCTKDFFRSRREPEEKTFIFLSHTLPNLCFSLHKCFFLRMNCFIQTIAPCKPFAISCGRHSCR